MTLTYFTRDIMKQLDTAASKEFLYGGSTDEMVDHFIAYEDTKSESNE